VVSALRSWSQQSVVYITLTELDIRATLQQKETMVDKIRRRLTWFGHVWMKEGCPLGQCTVILQEEGREEDNQRNG